MNKRTKIAVVLITLAVVLAGVGITLAFISSSSKPVINTFTVGNIQLKLSETTGTTYRLIPGTTVDKNPTLTVKAGSDSCWLFFRMDATGDLASCVDYEPAAGWSPLAGEEGVYYRQVDKSSQDAAFSLLKNNRVQVKETLTEEQLAALQTAPTLSFTGYAIQTYGVATAENAWQQLTSEGVTIG